MKKIRIFIASIMLILSCNAVHTYAKELNSSDINILNKSWNIKFNSDLDESSISRDNVYIKDQYGNKLKTLIKCHKNIVTLTPQENYDYNGKYKLYVEAGVKSQSGKQLKEQTSMKFNTNDMLKYEEMKLNKLNLYMSPTEVKDILGEPKRIEKKDEVSIDLVDLIYYYDNIKVGFAYNIINKEYYIWNMDANSPSIIGPRGIKVDDSVESVLNKFPVVEENIKEDGIKILYGEEYANNGQILYDENGNMDKIRYMCGKGSFDMDVFEIQIKDNKVLSISIWTPTV
ncbi:hypothetical protein Z965_04285 [Clostridium novyi A str. BKT29909]|uniref:Ig-like domain-containing protein n=1 Tax=Clostridium TaxID=1485 RepID=UPI0004D4DEA5|nr:MULTISPECIES: Ig-like domain-containing protein [Clostridium]KEH88819.1 hypothetical protein Z965_04285 [Clostridium novyi A str. BKT29909]KEH92733.1 hypothetical protein Z963_04905 [Clostridium botulinum C/D str. It1]